MAKQLSWQDVAEKAQAQMVAGEMIAFVGGRHEVLGKLAAGRFEYTAIGKMILASWSNSEGGTETPTASRTRARARAKGAPRTEVAETPAVVVEDAAEDEFDALADLDDVVADED